MALKFKAVINTDNAVLRPYRTMLPQIQQAEGIKISKKMCFSPKKS